MVNEERDCVNCNKERRYKTITRIYEEWNEWTPPLISEDTFGFNDLVKLYLDYQSSLFKNKEITKIDKYVIVKMDLYLKEIDQDDINYYIDLYHKGYGMLKIQDMYEKDLIFDRTFQDIESFMISGAVITFGCSLSIEMANKIQNHSIFVSDNYFYESRITLMNLLCESGFEYAKKEAKKRGVKIKKTKEGIKLINNFLEKEVYLIYTTLVKKAVVYVCDDIKLGKLDEEEASVKIFESANWYLNNGIEHNFKQFFGYPSMTSKLKEYLTTCLGFENPKEILENGIDDILDLLRDKDDTIYNNIDIKRILGLEDKI